MQDDYKRFTFTYGVVMLRTKRGLSIMDSLGKRRITKPLAWVMLFLLPLSGGIALFFILGEFLVYLSPRGGEVANYVATNIAPTANLLLPGLNPYVPIVDGWIAIVVAVVIHEASHGIVARSLGLKVKTAGLIFLLIVPIGAFVEVDETQMRETRARNSMRVLAAGSGINFIVSLVLLALLILSVSAMVPAANGSAITKVEIPSPASNAGLVPGDFITAVNGVPNNNLGTANLQPFEVVNLTVWHDGHLRVLTGIKLEEVIVTNTQTHQNTTGPYLGVNYSPYSSLTGLVSTYANPLSQPPARWVLYIIPPAFPGAQGLIPFSDPLKVLYTSPLGQMTADVQNLLFWVFFINFNLAIFNNLPIYPMDGGQALERFIYGAGRGRIPETASRNIITTVTVLLVFVLLGVIVGPYIYHYLL